MTNNANVVGSLPFSGKWLVGNTPAEKIPSHGTHLFGVTYAYDFMAVNDKKRVSSKIGFNTFFGTEDPENFYSFGKPIYAPVSGEIMKIHDGESDQKVRRSLIAGIPYLLSQAQRVRQGVNHIAGNYIIIQPVNSQNFICIVHIKKESFVVREGDYVRAGDQIAACGNSGNSTQPHIHIQAMDSLDLYVAKGIPLYFKQFYESAANQNQTILKQNSFPQKGKIIYFHN